MTRPTAADLAAWELFDARLEVACLNPHLTQPAVALEKAAHAAFRAVLPCPPYSAANPWFSCLNGARRFAGLPATQRIEMAGDLLRELAHARGFDGVATPAAKPAPGRAYWTDRD